MKEMQDILKRPSQLQHFHKFLHFCVDADELPKHCHVDANHCSKHSLVAWTSKV